MKQIFINLPVKNTEASMHFYLQLGFANNPLFTDEDQKCMMWSEHIYVMLIAEKKFNTYSKLPSDTDSKSLNAYFTLPVENLESVHKIIERGLQAGGSEPAPMIDEGFMQIRKLADPDGHIWDIIFLDLDKFKEMKK